MGLPADDMVDRLRKHRMDRRRTGEVFEFEGASIRLLYELLLAAVDYKKFGNREDVRALFDATEACDAAGLLPEEE